MRRTVIVVRHAKAEARGSTDRARVLTERGRSDSARLGRWLSAQELTPPVRSYVSDAARTRETWDLLSVELGTSVDVVVTGALYDAGTDDVLDLLSSDPDAKTIVVVGHNPTMESLAWELCERPTDRARLERAGFPTAACAVVDLDTDVATGVLCDLVTPRDL